MDVLQKLSILSAAAKYDASCTSSGMAMGSRGTLGSSLPTGCCHSFSADGRCISLLKLLMSNVCCYDCQYCVNRKTNDVPRASFTPRELADLTIEFYRRNYIEGLFLSSAVALSPDDTTERMIEVLRLLRQEHGFGGYIHAKALPGSSPPLLQRLGALCDRLSVNIELPSEKSLQLLAPDKDRAAILNPMGQIARAVSHAREERRFSQKAPVFAPAGQSTQMIVGATPESDQQILQLSEGLYQKYRLRRVFYSAYIPVSSSSLLPAPQEFKPPLLREHRLYQADWLLRFYHFRAEELVDEQNPNLHTQLDPKCVWALRHPEHFPIEVNRADYRTLLRVPGLGPTSAQRIIAARMQRSLDFDALRKLGVVLKRAQYFITCSGRMHAGLRVQPEGVWRHLLALENPGLSHGAYEQMSLFA